MSEPISEEFLLSAGFERKGYYWFIKESDGVGPIFNLRINLTLGCDGCCVQQKTTMVDNYVDIRMPEDQHEFRILCLALGVDLSLPITEEIATISIVSEEEKLDTSIQGTSHV